MKEHVVLLKAALADAVLLGTRLSELQYTGLIHEDGAAAVRESMDRLRRSTRAFLDSSGLSELTNDDVFPLYQEIQRKTATRSNH